MTRESLVFLSGKRTPFGANGGSLKDVLPSDLGASCSKAAMTAAGVEPGQIEHVIYGNVLPSTADAAYIPRHVGLKAGIPIPVPALGVNRLCGSGFQAIVDAYQQMQAGDTRLALVGGVENMSAAPYVLRGARYGLRMGHAPLTDMLFELLTDPYAGIPMAVTAENLAKKYSISREESDRFSLRSQQKAGSAQAEGRFGEEISAYTIQPAKGDVITVSKDEHLRPQTTMEGLAKLKPVFQKDGVVTAGNASGIVDGAASLVVATESYAKEKNLKPIGRLIAYGISGCDPSLMGIGPVPAAREAMKRANLTMGQMDLVEVNEAFAPQALSVQKELGIPDEIFNVNGGAIAIGHPLGASGARITMHLLHELCRRKKRYGLGSACIGGGQGIALIVEAL